MGAFQCISAYIWPEIADRYGVATIGQVFQEARTPGAIVVQVNHPFIPYGYFTSLGAGTVPGGFNRASI